jgi:hypothetical protein
VGSTGGGILEFTGGSGGGGRNGGGSKDGSTTTCSPPLPHPGELMLSDTTKMSTVMLERRAPYVACLHAVKMMATPHNTMARV